MVSNHKRREVLKYVGAAGVVGLAGCAGDGDGGGTDTTTTGDGTTTGTGTGTGTGTETETGQGTGTTSDVSERTIRMGILMGVTGGLQDLGPPIRDAAQLAVTQVNDAGGPFTVDAQFEDTGTDANTGISNANSLVNAGYPMICGALSSSVTLQVARNVLVPNGVVGCSPASTSPAITDLQDNDLVWRTPPSDALQGGALAQVAAQRHDASTASTLYLNNAYGQALSESFASSFRDQQGGEVLQQVSFEEERSSYTGQLQQALSGDPDTMVIVGYPASGVTIFRDFYNSFNRDIPILVTDGLRDQTLPGDVGNNMENVYGTAPSAAGPAREYFATQYQEAYGSSPGVFTAQSFDAAAVLMLANAAAGENTGEVIKGEMMRVANPGGTEVTPENLVEGLSMAAGGQDVAYAGASSSVDFNDAGDITGAVYSYFHYTGGSVEEVDTIEFTANG